MGCCLWGCTGSDTTERLQFRGQLKTSGVLQGTDALWIIPPQAPWGWGDV